MEDESVAMYSANPEKNVQTFGILKLGINVLALEKAIVNPASKSVTPLNSCSQSLYKSLYEMRKKQIK